MPTLAQIDRDEQERWNQLKQDALRRALGVGQVARGAGQNFLSLIGSGIFGPAAAGPGATMGETADVIRRLQEAGTYQPGPEAAEVMAPVGQALNWGLGQAQRVPGLPEAARGVQQGWEDFTVASPLLASLLAAAPAALDVATGAGKRGLAKTALEAGEMAGEAAPEMVTLYRAQQRGKPIKNWFSENKNIVGDYHGIYAANPEGVDLYRLDVPMDEYEKYLMAANKRGESAEGFGAGQEAYVPRAIARTARIVSPDEIGIAPKKARPGLSNAEIRQLTRQEPDVGRSLITEAKDVGVEPGRVEAALANRAALRQEPATTPGALASEQQWSDWGSTHGVNMTRTPSTGIGIRSADGTEIMIPGGLEGTFTIPDLFELKAKNFDPNLLPKDVHDKLMEKFVRTHNITNPDEVDVFNRLAFAQLSPNAPLLPNEFLTQRFRVRNLAELQDLAARRGEAGLSQSLDLSSGVGAAGRGGMGVKGTAELGNLSDLASLVLQRPDMFRAGPGETLRDVTMRVMNQVPGLGPKTASLGVPWLDLPRANTSAVDLHMIRNNYDRLLDDPQVGAGFTKRMSKKLGVEETPAAVRAAMANDPGAAEEAAISIIGGSSRSTVYRGAKTGNVNPDIPASMQPERLAYEPKQMRDFNEFYSRIVDYVDESRGANPTLELFPEQWRLWDRYRGRVEPHEFAHPDYRKLPRQSWSEMQEALSANKAAGFAAEGPTTPNPTNDWRQLYYGHADPGLLALLGIGTAAAAGGAAAYGRSRREEPPQK